MPPCRSDRSRPTLARDDAGVSEVVGFLLTFGIISMILVTAMIGFGSAQQRSYERVAEAQASSIAQRVSGVLVDAALFLEGTDCSSLARLSLLLEVPATVANRGFLVQLNDTAGTVVVSTGLTTPQSASLFGAAKDSACAPGGDTRPRLCPVSSSYDAANGGNLYVVFDGSCLGVANAPVT